MRAVWKTARNVLAPDYHETPHINGIQIQVGQRVCLRYDLPRVKPKGSKRNHNKGRWSGYLDLEKVVSEKPCERKDKIVRSCQQVLRQ